MGRLIKLQLSENVGIKESFSLRQKIKGYKKFAREIIQGWFSSRISKYGVYKLRVIDKINNSYKEYVRDLKTGRVIRNVEEKLTDHRK